MHGKKAISTICLWASTIFSSAREFGSPWIGRRKELSNICRIILTIFLNEETVFFWYYYYYCIMKERCILYTISAHTCIKLPFCCIFRCYSFDNVYNSLLFVDGFKLNHSFTKSFVTWLVDNFWYVYDIWSSIFFLFFFIVAIE